ncbi:MAG: hypothetical protein P1U61_06715 [Legionellaceae bacterium]|nr:hypothetical protein [Legionellaceae bacterium]
MKDWLKRFYGPKDSVTLTLDGQTFPLKDCVELGGGHEKTVFKLKGQSQCFFIPHNYRNEADWNDKIEDEKMLLDQISELGLKTQRFEIEPLVIKEPDQPDYEIKVLIAQDFEDLCKKESLVIYDKKSTKKVIGERFDLIALKDKLVDKQYAQQLLEKIINEYAVALTFKLPTSTVVGCHMDDSEHICFELPKNADLPPVARFMFWDVVSDFYGAAPCPRVPTLKSLKSGNEQTSDTELSGLKTLTNTVVCAMGVIDSRENELAKPQDYWSFYDAIEDALLKALNDDAFLNQSLIHTREVVIRYLNNALDELNREGLELDSDKCFEVILSVITTGNLDLLKRVFQIKPKAFEVSQEMFDLLIHSAKDYDNKLITDFLEEKLKLKGIADNPEKDKTVSNKKQVSSPGLCILYGVGMMGGGAALCLLAALTMKPIIAVIGVVAIVLGGIGLAHTYGFFSKSEGSVTEETDNIPAYQC